MSPSLTGVTILSSARLPLTHTSRRVLLQVHVVDELYMLTQVSGSDQSKERTPVGVPQQQPVGADDDGIQVAHTSLVKGKGYPIDRVTHKVDKGLELKSGKCSASKHFPQHF